MGALDLMLNILILINGLVVMWKIILYFKKYILKY
jgi:hypothetical protein